MTYFYLKATHIVFVVTWFAALFYMPRLFVYHYEALEKEEPAKSILKEQFLIMEKRLWYGIAWPSCFITIILGFWLASNLNVWMESWFVLKFSLIIALVLYHMSLQNIFNKIKKGEFPYSSVKMRIWNEVATLLLISIVFIVVLKDTLNFLWGILGLLILTGFIMIGVRAYKKSREKKLN